MPPKAKQEAADPAVTMADVAPLNQPAVPAAAEAEVPAEAEVAAADERPVFISAGMLHDIEQHGYAYDHVTRRKITAADAEALGYGVTTPREATDTAAAEVPAE